MRASCGASDSSCCQRSAGLQTAIPEPPATLITRPVPSCVPSLRTEQARPKHGRVRTL
jgi:hypothetical protein